MDFKKLNEKLEQFVESQYIIYDDEWEDSHPIDQKGVIDFAIEHYLDRADDIHAEIEYEEQNSDELSPLKQQVKNIKLYRSKFCSFFFYLFF